MVALLVSVCAAVIWQRPKDHSLEGFHNLGGRANFGDERPDSNNVASSRSIDTFIPRGYTLVPVEVQNSESLDSIFGQRGIVDLYSVPVDSGAQPMLLGQRLRMLRAPNNPLHFAVLVREEESVKIARHAGPVFVVIHNDLEKGTTLLPEAKTPRRGIHIVEEKE